jgi:hypothetical protein
MIPKMTHDRNTDTKSTLLKEFGMMSIRKNPIPQKPRLLMEAMILEKGIS